MTEYNTELSARIERAREQLEQFQQLLANAQLELRVENFGPELGRQLNEDHQRAFEWRLIEDFFEPYQTAGVYPLDRLPGTTYWLMDLRLQLHSLRDSLIPMHNRIVFRKEFQLESPLTHPMQYLDHISITQSMISQARVLWERLMGLVYFLETGSELQDKKTSRRSAKAAFFKAVPTWQGRWEPLAEWKSELVWYDDNFRTPEFHSSSRLRKGIFTDGMPDPNAIIGLLDPVQNGFWDLLRVNVKGCPIPSGWRLGRAAASSDRMDEDRLSREAEQDQSGRGVTE